MIRKPNRALQQSWTHRHKRRWLRRKTERKPSQLSKSGVGVEKVRFPQNSKQLGDRKCLGKPRKSFVGHPNAILFLRISREGVFQQPRLVSTVMAIESTSVSGSWFFRSV